MSEITTILMLLNILCWVLAILVVKARDDIKSMKFRVSELEERGKQQMCHSNWETVEHQHHYNVVCLNCKKEYYVYKQGQYKIQNSNYCPNCGAKMDLEE